jgi:hypothetical protein
MKQRVEEMEREAKKLRELQAAAESSTSLEQTEGEGGLPMETEDEKAMIDSRSVFVGNVSDPMLMPLFIPPPSKCFCTYRLITVRQRKISRPTFRRVVPSTASPSSATNSRVIPKGK